MITDANVAVAWFAVGIVFVLIEAFGAMGVGFLFAGMGAICVALLIEADYLNQNAHLYQFIWFFLLTVVWAVVLWKPIRRLQKGKNGAVYSNIVGDTATVGASGVGRREGQVEWSGTTMRAKLADDVAAERLEKGVLVEVVAVKGTVLIVRPVEKI